MALRRKFWLRAQFQTKTYRVAGVAFLQGVLRNLVCFWVVICGEVVDVLW
jgi:hypothetical protein